REALRRLRDDNLVASRPRAGTLVVPRPATNSYAQDVMSINDLLAFATRAPVCKTEYYINRAFAAVGRLLQRHSGPIFPLIEDLFGVSVVEVHQEISAIATSRELAALLGVETGSAALEMQRTYTTSDGEVAQVTVNTHPAARYRHSMTMRRIKGLGSGP